MEPIKTILVGLDLTDIDETLIDHVITMSQKTELQKVYFINIQKSLDLPEEVKKKHPGLLAPKDEQIKKIITDNINSSPVGKLEADYEIKIIEGPTTEELLKWTNIKEVDLLVLGKKLSFESSGIASGKIAMTVPCSVFFIPEVMPVDPNIFLVPVDFSESSMNALEQAIRVSQVYEGSEIKCVHFYEVPSGYHTSGKTFEEFAEIMKANAAKEFTKFMDSMDEKARNIQCEFILNKTESVASQIFKYALREGVSGIIIGSKGRTMAASLILGSVAEKLQDINTHLPLFIAKEKNKNLGLFDALFNT